jgi:hypothetical protein
MNDTKTPDPAQPGSDPDMQGEGNYDAARRHRKSVEHYMDEADIPQDARDAAPDSAQEAEELRKAEREGESHARR